MRELSFSDIEQVDGAVSAETAVNLVGAVAGVAAIIGAPVAATLGAGIVVGYYGAKFISEW